MRYIELFAGIGGMGHGLMQAGMECVGFCELDKFAHKAFKILHDPNERMWSAYDVRSVTDEHLRLLERERGRIDLIAGGFPCQAFSIAGKRKGFADATRGTLLFEIIRFASVLRPNYLLLENVTGLLNHDGGGKPSQPSSVHWMSWGTMRNGVCLTARHTSPKTGNGCSLSQVLEDNVDPKYFLSEQKTATLLKSLGA